MKNATLVLFGDSYAAGRIPHSQTDGAFRAALGGCVVADHALSGSTAVQWSGDIDGRLSNVRSAPAHVAVGSLIGNDALAAIADGMITPGEALSALAALALVLYRIGRSMPVVLMIYADPFAGKRPDTAEGVRRLNTAIMTVINAVNCSPDCGPVIPLDLRAVLRPEHFDGLDIHPNEAGYQAMADAVLQLIERM